jgi:hypothetical protein
MNEQQERADRPFTRAWPGASDPCITASCAMNRPTASAVVADVSGSQLPAM